MKQAEQNLLTGSIALPKQVLQPLINWADNCLYLVPIKSLPILRHQPLHFTLHSFQLQHVAASLALRESSVQGRGVKAFWMFTILTRKAEGNFKTYKTEHNSISQLG